MSENGQTAETDTEPRDSTHAHLAGEVIGRHQHGYHQLLYVSAGVLAVQTGEASWVASSARAMWIPAGTWHQHRVHGHSSVHTLGFPLHDVLLDSGTPVVVAVDALVRELIIACSEPSLPLPEANRLRAVLRDRLRRALIEPLTLPVPGNPLLRQACALVADDLQHPRTAVWLAKRIGVSERTLARLFRTELGMTYPQWRTNVRVFHAMVLLAEGANVSETGRRCGWATTSAFIDTFNRTMGQTPGAYRTESGA
ncbi:putative transcriptional regulator, AraC family protein [Streptomyces tauricus]|uniref:Helix-turn-helix transcriptional regulator n=1 Tax=Streptomyces tauricus TaxID=68274 RepID=A0ABZ1J621_9ACTN|nr:helix-turn-helix transcriptional regulator [Streptomyces tauricus]GHA08946.1 putative transcriptional regulator, AraC family protein [Streptomyces tauricus]